jgi:hypothetical protein
MKKIIFLFACLSAINNQVNAQAGLTISPGKLYYTLSAGSTGTQKITVSNPNNKEIQIGVSVNDWNYDSVGVNHTYDAGTLKTSCADWIQVMPGSYFTLQPNERRELDIVFKVPPGAATGIPVHTAMLFLTQLNPGEVTTKNGTSIKVTVRMGIKLYHAFSKDDERNLAVINFKDILPSNNSGFLELELNNTGKTWLDTKIKWELINTQTGAKLKLEDQDFYSLPGDKRFVRLKLPDNLKKGKYNATAIINYGDKDQLKVAELEFTH